MPTADIVAVILCLQTKAISSACIILSTHQPRHQGRISWHPGEPTNILHMKKAILGNASTERYLFIWHLHVGHTVFARMVWFVVLMSPSALSIAPSPSRMDSLTPTASFSAHMYFWRLDIQWIVASLQWREFCPVCFNIYLFLSHSPPQAFFLADFSHQHCVCWETTTPRGECWRGGRNRSKSIYWM